jgi:hypothetical protein
VSESSGQIVQPAAGTPPRRQEVGQILETVGRVIAPVTVLTSALYYFGYVREQALFGYFGVDLGSVGFSPADYVLRSAGTVFLPLVLVVMGLLAALVLHRALSLVVAGSGMRRRRMTGRLLVVLAVALLGVGVLDLAGRGTVLSVTSAFLAGGGGNGLWSALLPPLALGSGAVLLEYTATVVLLPRESRPVMAPTRLRRGLLVILALVAAFWATTDVAVERGESAARTFEVSLPLQPEIVVYSRLRLQIADATVHRLSQVQAAYHFRYDGLRLLVHQNHVWFLLPAGWTHTNGMRVILLNDAAPDVRIELGP